MRENHTAFERLELDAANHALDALFFAVCFEFLFINIQSRLRVAAQDARRKPILQVTRGGGVRVFAPRQFEADDVIGVFGEVRFALFLRKDIVGRTRQRGDLARFFGIAQSAEGLQNGHTGCSFSV